MHLYCSHVLPWSVCAKCAQHQELAAFHTRAGHKDYNPYNNAYLIISCVYVALLHVLGFVLVGFIHEVRSRGQA